MARPKLGKGDSQRLQMVISDEELEAIEEWQHNNRVKSKSDAIRRLCRIGLLVDSALEDIVDSATAGVEILSDHASALTTVYRELFNDKTADLKYGAEEVSQVVEFASQMARDAEEGMGGLHHMLLALYNAIAPIADARTFQSGVKASEERLAEANAIADKASEKKAERDDNRYFHIAMMSSPMTVEDRRKYEAMSEDEQDAYWDKLISALKAEEEADPLAFRERYYIKMFWQKPGWAARLRESGGSPLVYMKLDESDT
ncbi:hypothetical protein [Mesorhizobium sp. M4B.F.Ca.ET.017.02.2.1]|uniref:hypothetical protein n=1 Tax=Mesorhizobium sp. M4B.F.Ca.ET.017.02.2.1 TaxID=2496649 RepID=UPI000FCC0F6C|nr:hypothetical protein [Mesorhizobium sp. M4B.F.Ca.ET.017.02.2.1]RVD31441.1 hypothetical protein EN738_01940 [Mesorhizobium sp. M4B.F.Ca.ET.017.02.2.1]